jgi:hypothetical protein
MFQSWIDLLHSYNSIQSVLENPVRDSYTNDYYQKFEFDKEDEDAVFTITELNYIRNYLLYIEENIDSYVSKENKTKIDEIKSEIKLLQQNIGENKKVYALRKLSSIWAKMTEISSDLVREFVPEFKKQVINRATKFIIENGTDAIQSISNHVSGLLS